MVVHETVGEITTPDVQDPATTVKKSKRIKERQRKQAETPSKVPHTDEDVGDDDTAKNKRRQGTKARGVARSTGKRCGKEVMVAQEQPIGEHNRETTPSAQGDQNSGSPLDGLEDYYGCSIPDDPKYAWLDMSDLTETQLTILELVRDAIYNNFLVGGSFTIVANDIWQQKMNIHNGKHSDHNLQAVPPTYLQSHVSLS